MNTVTLYTQSDGDDMQVILPAALDAIRPKRLSPSPRV